MEQANNETRAARAESTLDYHGVLVGDEAGAPIDLLTDLLHAYNRNGWDFENDLRIARDNFEAEVGQ